MADKETKTEEVKEEVPEPVSTEPKGAGLRFKKSRGVCRKCRRAGEKLFLKGERCFSAKCSYTRRSYIPGQHGNKGMRRLSQYGLQLREKQKLAVIYGLRERQLLKYFAVASHKKGKTGDILMSLLERRLDNIVFRAGLSSSRREARQKVKIRKFLLNGRSIDIPSILVKKGDIISPKDAKKEKNKEKEQRADLPKWIELNNKNQEIKIIRLPDRLDISEPINEQLVVEFYSK
ncbi:30S ribosomal protein S4 [Patescibacteria group bacterium]|nr:30S ribosomal protein S4 [Patescibacteria group bacterium]